MSTNEKQPPARGSASGATSRPTTEGGARLAGRGRSCHLPRRPWRPSRGPGGGVRREGPVSGHACRGKGRRGASARGRKGRAAGRSQAAPTRRPRGQLVSSAAAQGAGFRQKPRAPPFFPVLTGAANQTRRRTEGAEEPGRRAAELGAGTSRPFTRDHPWRRRRLLLPRLRRTRLASPPPRLPPRLRLASASPPPRPASAPFLRGLGWRRTEPWARRLTRLSRLLLRKPPSVLPFAKPRRPLRAAPGRSYGFINSANSPTFAVPRKPSAWAPELPRRRPGLGDTGARSVTRSPHFRFCCSPASRLEINGLSSFALNFLIAKTIV
ncbi:uncharacterized protein LOC144323126 [Canis aureus]